MIDALHDLIGLPPAGLEWLEYLVLCFFVFLGVLIIYRLICLFIGKFLH